MIDTEEAVRNVNDLAAGPRWQEQVAEGVNTLRGIVEGDPDEFLRLAQGRWNSEVKADSLREHALGPRPETFEQAATFFFALAALQQLRGERAHRERDAFAVHCSELVTEFGRVKPGPLREAPEVLDSFRRMWDVVGIEELPDLAPLETADLAWCLAVLGGLEVDPPESSPIFGQLTWDEIEELDSKPAPEKRHERRNRRNERKKPH